VLLLLCFCFCASTVLGLLVKNYNIPPADSSNCPRRSAVPTLPALSRAGAISLQEPEVQVNSIDYPTNTAFNGLKSSDIAVINMATFQRTTVSNVIDTASTGGTAYSVTACIIDGANIY